MKQKSLTVHNLSSFSKGCGVRPLNFTLWVGEDVWRAYFTRDRYLHSMTFYENILSRKTEHCYIMFHFDLKVFAKNIPE